MKIVRSKLYSKSEKSIKKYIQEKENLDRIINHIKNCYDFNELKSSPLSHVFGFERLKHELNNYYSFNLCKKGGTIRLIFLVDEEINQVCLEFISKKHYEDFKGKI